MKFRSSLVALASIGLGLAPGLGAQTTGNKPKLNGYFAYKAAGTRDVEALRNANPNLSNVPGLPLWNYTWQASRDGFIYTGTMVGSDPFSQHNSTAVPTYVVPLILQLNRVATAVDQMGNITTAPGKTVFSSSAPDTACLSAPNNVPATLVEQSPIFQKANFYFGNTAVGDTQYVDAFQRANFWHEIGSTLYSTYHVNLTPHMLSPVFINVPAKYGTALPPALFGTCAPLGFVNIDWFDALIANQVLPALRAFGITPSTFPLLVVHNLVWGDNSNLGQCCVLGYHSFAGSPAQTYSPADFDTTGAFPPALQDTGILSHEVAEWMDDPFGSNLVPAWGHIGQESGCQGNLEVGDPLTGSLGPSVVMPNGFTYHLQELAFFSWFMGAPSLGLHNWFSNNASFTKDAGAPCVSSANSATASSENQSHLVIVR